MALVPAELPRTFRQVVETEIVNHPRYIGTTGKVSWSALARDLPGVHYETLRLMISEQRTPSDQVMEAVARVLGLDPLSFAEYWVRQFDPRVVGLEQALENLARWAEQQRS